MKKNKPFRELFSRSLKKTLLIMRITVVLMILGILDVQANDAYAQKTRLSLNFSETELVKVLDKIEDESEFFFLYNEKLLDTERKVSIDAKDQLVSLILDKLFTGTDVQYTIIDRKIILAPGYLTEAPQNQQVKVSGTITDASTGEALPGVNVVVRGTTIGAITDVNGSFTLNVPNASATLQFSFIGYITQDIPFIGQSVLNVNLKSDVAQLDEVVVVGYGTQKRKDVTGVVASVGNKEIKDLTVTRVDQVLMGKVAGVQVKINNGEPGASPQIRIRGIGSISAGAQPLYVVDGFPMSSIETINPNDIESIDVLKDASAAAIYGSRGSNGVIIINTKKGKLGKAIITFDSYYGLQKVSKRPEFLSALELAQYYYDGTMNRNKDAGKDVSGPPNTWNFPVPAIILDVLSGANTTDVDKVKEVLQTAPMVQYQLGASGGTENIKYALSGEYLDQDGIVINNNFKRYSVRANVDAKLSKRLNVKFNLTQSLIKRRIVNATGVSTGGNNESVLGNAMSLTQFYPLYNTDGSYFIYSGLDAAGNYLNPAALANEVQNMDQYSFFQGNFNAEYSITNSLKFIVLMGGSIGSQNGTKFVPMLPVFFNNPAYGESTTSQRLNWLSEYTLNFNKSFGNHNFTALGGFTSQKETYSSNYLMSDKYPNNLVPSLSAVSGIITNGTASTGAWSLVSYLGRVNYNFASKYYLTASIRTDGSSRFGSQKKYGLFPSAAVAWSLTDEEFLKTLNFLNHLKLRVSYGETGNNNIGDYEQYATISYLKYPLNGLATAGFAPQRLSNPNLTWEKQRSLNAGFDASILDNRVIINVDRFRSTNTNLLLNVNIPDILGFSTSLQNIGEVRNTGWEFAVSTINFKGKFEWTTDFNLTTARNKVIRLGPEGDQIINGGNITMVGQPIGMFYGWLIDGVFKNQDEVDAGPIFNPGTTSASHPGDTRFVDVSGPDGVPDGIINSFDKTIMGTPYPDFFYGMTNRFSYKNISLSVSLQGVHGNSILSVSRRGTFSTRGRFAISSIIGKDYWKSEQNPGDGFSSRPNDAPTGNIRGEFSQRWLDNGSYLRINNITLGYMIPDRLTNRLNINSLRFYVTATNPFIITKNAGFNPDVSNGDNPLTPGNDLNDYPLPKSMLIGLNLSF